MTEPEKTCLLAGISCFDAYETQGPGLSPNCATIHPEAWRMAFETDTQMCKQILEVIKENRVEINNEKRAEVNTEKGTEANKDKPNRYRCISQEIALRGGTWIRDIIAGRQKDSIEPRKKDEIEGGKTNEIEGGKTDEIEGI
ncbi:hypothetical protein IQ07DRAFT_644146 [Pyrenochaeta sp. DS3sAY3a]|nr:hypothetical protein IQ07DRAFT_644146 [Pyrenochaeta sp. DS3sAY3a]